MLIALLTMLILGGGSTAMLGLIADTEDSVKTVMVKDERRKAALKTLKSMKKRTNARNKHVKRATKVLNRSLQQVEINAAEIDTIWNDYFAEVEQYDHAMLDLRFELKEHVNRDEWQQIFAVD